LTASSSKSGGTIEKSTFSQTKLFVRYEKSLSRGGKWLVRPENVRSQIGANLFLPFAQAAKPANHSAVGAKFSQLVIEK